MINTTQRTLSRLFAILVLSGFIAISLVSSSNATSAAGFNAGKIIDDAVFTNSYSMNVDQIQAFLNSKVPNCDTNGTQPATDFGRPDLTHAQYAATRGWPAPPYPCLKDYTQNGLRSAQIIYSVAQQYQINPQVLIVLLQKEQGLVTDTWPLPVQYRSATGYGCPDTAACDSAYYGLTAQLHWAGTMFHAIAANDQNWSNPYRSGTVWYTPYVLGENFIYWSPNSSCGGTVVNIQNRSTQALYNYTPYQPNQSALNAGYGIGDACGAYGNRNFYLYFTDWFGSTQDKLSLNLMTSMEGALSAGTTLQAGNYISSPNGRFVMVMRYDGSLVIYRGTVAIWSSGTTQTSYGSRATFQGDGNFVIYTIGNVAIWSSGTDGTGSNAISLSDTGSLEISADDIQKWSTNDMPTNPSNFLANSSTLQAGGEIRSTDGYFRLIMQGDGNLVMYATNGPALWNSGTDKNLGAFLAVQGDGNMVVYSSTSRPLWSSGTAGKGSSNLYMQPDGNLVLYNQNGATWSSGTDINGSRSINYKGDKVQEGVLLHAGEYLRSNDYRYRIYMQYDGNLVLKSINGNKVLWSSGTDKNLGAFLAVQGDGNMVVYSSTSRPLWSSGTAGKGSSNLYMQPDGNLVLYNQNGATWSSGTDGRF